MKIESFRLARCHAGTWQRTSALLRTNYRKAINGRSDACAYAGVGRCHACPLRASAPQAKTAAPDVLDHGCQDGAKGEGLGSNSRGHCPLMCQSAERGECIRADADGATRECTVSIRWMRHPVVNVQSNWQGR